ncbi:MAG: hypothetical protein ACTSU5_05690 [Promethearchaeota archaeon]
MVRQENGKKCPRLVKFAGILVFLLVGTGTIGGAVARPDWVPAADDRVAGYTLLYESELDFYNYDSGLANTTGYTSVWYKNDTSGQTVAVVGVLALDFGVNVLDAKISPVAKAALATQYPGFSGDSVWDLLVFYLNDTGVGGEINATLVGAENVTRAIEVELDGYHVVFGFTGSVAIGVLALEVDATWWQYYDEGLIEEKLNLHLWALSQVLQSLQTVWGTLTGAGQPTPSTAGPSAPSPLPAGDRTSDSDTATFASNYAGAVNEGKATDDSAGDDSTGDTGSSGGLDIPGFPLLVLVPAT